MNLSTLTLYSIASGLCFALCLLLLVFSQVRRGTYLLRMSAWSLITLAIGFLFAGVAPSVPLWIIVIDTNVVLLAPGVLLFSGVRAFITQQPPRLDWTGIGLIAASVPFFFYWGMVEPDGMRRATVFSIADMLINARTAWLLIQHLRHQRFRVSLLVAAASFAVFSAWMAVRAVHLMLADPLPSEIKAGNPTSWLTVFAMIMLIAVFVANLFVMEIGELQQRRMQENPLATGATVALRDHLTLLWGVVMVVVLAIVSELGIAYLVIQQRELQRLQEQNTLANQVLVDHASQWIRQADLALRATRDLVQSRIRQGDLAHFVGQLDLQRPAFEGIFITDAKGELILPQTGHAHSASTFHLDYFRIHLESAEDILYIGPVTKGPITGKHQFRISRRIQDAQGRFAGVAFIPMEPLAFTQHYSQVMQGDEKVAALIGTTDHLTRAALTPTDLDRMQTPLNTPLWSLLAKADTGNFQNLSPVDGVLRQFHFRKLSGLPLVMVTGFSEADVRTNALQTIRPFALATGLSMAILLTMAYLLSVALRRRDEQERFLSMISHELRTPMSVISMVSGSSAVPAETRDRVARAVNSMSAIIDSALQADRIRHGRIQTAVSDCDVAALLQHCCQDSTDPSRLQLDAHALPACKTDAHLLQIIVGNLLDNALKYSLAGSLVHVQARPRVHRRQSGVAISVSNLPGAAGNPDARQIFRKFYRAPGAHGKSGSGLGLHIAEGLTRLLGGHLKYGQSDGKVQFTLWIPL